MPRRPAAVLRFPSLRETAAFGSSPWRSSSDSSSSRIRSAASVDFSPVGDAAPPGRLASDPSHRCTGSSNWRDFRGGAGRLVAGGRRPHWPKRDGLCRRGAGVRADKGRDERGDSCARKDAFFVPPDSAVALANSGIRCSRGALAAAHLRQYCTVLSQYRIVRKKTCQ